MDNMNILPGEDLDDATDTTITLNDEEGNEVEYDFLDLLEHNGAEYLFLLPKEAAERSEVVILRVETDENGEESYVTLDSMEEARSAFEAFQEKVRQYMSANPG